MLDPVDAEPWLVELSHVVDMLRCHEESDVAVILVGSAARGVRGEASDIDLLVVRKNRPKIPKSVSGYHIQLASEADFMRNLSAGEDFEAWCVRFGKTLYDDGIWARIKSSPAASAWPKWQVKVTHGARRLFLATALLGTGDIDAAIEETVYALGHAARGILIRASVFPLSRPELAAQVSEAGFPHLADIHEKLRDGTNVSLHDLRLAQLYCKKLLCHIDSGTYGKYAKEFVLTRTAKKAEHAARFSTH